MAKNTKGAPQEGAIRQSDHQLAGIVIISETNPHTIDLQCRHLARRFDISNPMAHTLASLVYGEGSASD